MGSQLQSIVDTVVAMTVTGYAMDVYAGDNLRNVIDIANLPARVVNAIGFAGSVTKTATFGAGHVMVTEWTITDTALLRKAGTGYGLKDIAPDLTGYLAAYHNAVRSLIDPRWSVTRVTTRAQVLEWPQASAVYYDAVQATLTISEIVE